MTDLCVLPDFTADQASDILVELFDLHGSLKILNGERDLNYLLKTESGSFVFKIANRDEPYGMLECQHQVLELMQVSRVLPKQARSQLSVNGRVIEIIESESGVQHYCRLLDYIEGCVLSKVHPHSPELLQDLGKTLAKLDQSLQGFSHEALNRPLLWNMNNALKTLEQFKSLLASQHKRDLVAYFETHYRNSLGELKQDLRSGVIHNDANDNNVLVEDNRASIQQISSIIDFGDMVNSWIAAEPAIAAAYAMLGNQEPLESALIIVSAYHAQFPLNRAEIAMQFDFICMRLCMSVCICAYQRSIDPDNAYLEISEQPAWALLEKIRDMEPDSVISQINHACGTLTESNY